MLVPVRCFTCGNLIADKFEEYKKRIGMGDEAAEIFDSLDVKRYCCRRMLLATLETIEQIIPFYESIYKRNLEIQTELE